MLARYLRLALLGSLGACSLSTSGLAPPEGADQGGARSASSGAGAAGATSGGGMSADDWWDDAFSKRVRITFKNEDGEELNDFPVMVKLDATRIDYGASPTGSDLRFVDADGKTLLAHEIDHWSPSDNSFVWVRVPKIDKASGADHMWLYYGNQGAPDTQDAATVWAGFVGVYHLSPNTAAPTAVVDSTRAYPGGWSGRGGDPVAGVIGDAAGFDGSQFVEVGNIDEFSVDPGEAHTVEVWLNPEALQEQYIVHQEGQCRGWLMGISENGSYTGHLSAESDADICGFYNEYEVKAAASLGAWSYLTLVMDRPASVMRLFVDGVLMDTVDIDNTADADGNGSFRIGTDWDDSSPFNGSIDEVRVSSSARSAGWIAAQHRSMTDGFLSFDAK
jgi:hypothetical protein